MTSITTDVLRIHVEVTGPTRGRPVLLLHGWPDAARGWQRVAVRLHEAGYRTVIPCLRGSGETRFVSKETPRDAQAVALAQDAVDLLDALGLEQTPIVGHDWGARIAYTLSALWPERVSCAVTLALAYQPRGEFAMPSFSQARALWYEWLMCLDAGAAAVAADPVGFARMQWETWSPAGWWDNAEFAATAVSFRNPDWVPITLNNYRARFLPGEPRDSRYDELRARLHATGHITVPTLMLQGGSDFCDEPTSSEGLDGWFTGAYRRVVLDGVGHFPHREAPDEVARVVVAYLEGRDLSP